jgi:hypothetical protein
VLRLADTMVGIEVGFACTWAGSFLSYMRYLRQQTEEIMTGRKTFFGAVHSTAASTRSPMETLKLSLDSNNGLPSPSAGSLRCSRDDVGGALQIGSDLSIQRMLGERQVQAATAQTQAHLG